MCAVLKCHAVYLILFLVKAQLLLLINVIFECYKVNVCTDACTYVCVCAHVSMYATSDLIRHVLQRARVCKSALEVLQQQSIAVASEIACPLHTYSVYKTDLNINHKLSSLTQQYTLHLIIIIHISIRRLETNKIYPNNVNTFVSKNISFSYKNYHLFCLKMHVSYNSVCAHMHIFKMTNIW